MSTPSSGWAGNNAGGERSGVTETLGSMYEIQQQLAALPDGWDSSLRAGETAKAAGMTAAQVVEGGNRKGREVSEGLRMDHGRVTSSTLVGLRRCTTTATALAREHCEVAALYPEVSTESPTEHRRHSGAKRNAVEWTDFILENVNEGVLSLPGFFS